MNGSISELRQKAQSHLREIAEEIEAEEREKLHKQRESERYLRVRRKPKIAARDSLGCNNGANGANITKLRPAQDVLDRFRWDPAYKSSDYVVGYLDRFDGLREMPLDSWVPESTEEEWIPQHRIKYFKDARGGVVWHRDQRIDEIFGSGSNQATGDPDLV